MPDYVLNRNYALATTAGRVFNFKKGVPTYVNPDCEKDALAIGAQPVDGPKDILDPELEPVLELSPDEREAAIFGAFAKLEARQNRGDFTAQGAPSAKVIDSLLGFDLQTKERDAMWAAYKKQKAEVEE